MTQTPPQKTGLLDPSKTYADVGADIATVSHAVTKRWPVDDKTRAVLVDRLKRIALFDANSRRATRAAEVLVRMEGQNQSDEHATAAPGNASPNVVIFLPDNGRGDGQQRQHSQQAPPPQPNVAPALSAPIDVESIPLGPRIPATQPTYREQAERTKAAQAGRPAPENEPPPPETAEHTDVQQTPTAGPGSRQPDDDGQ